MKSNINKPIKLHLFIMMIGSCIMACQDLEENPKSFASPNTFYKDPSQIEAVFTASMNNLWNSWSGYGWAMRSAFQNTDSQNGGDLNISQNHGSDLWAGHYSSIANINPAIRAMKEGKLDGVPQNEVDLLIGQAKFLRAFNYFMLVRMFGDLPLLTDETEDQYNTLLERTPVAGVYELIVNDLREAIEKLPPTWPTDQKGRPTSDVAKGLLAKAYLTMATAPLNEVSYYQQARDLSKEVIDAGRYTLVEDIHKVFSLETEFGPEIMWSFISNYEDVATSPQIWSSMRGWGDISVQTEWLEEFPEQPRKQAFFEMENSEGVGFEELGRFAGVKKYQYDSEEDFDAGRSIINIPILRLADVLLIFAEADNMVNSGPTPEAVEAINKVIDRANGYIYNSEHPRLTINMTQAEFDTAVIEERNFELCFEFDRWFDLVRKRILEQESRETIRQNFSEADYLFPIPENDLRLNPLLIQNPGY